MQGYIVTSQATPVVLYMYHRVLEPMALPKTTQRVFVARHRVVQAPAYIAMIHLVCVDEHVAKLTVLLQTTQSVSVAQHLALEIQGCIVTNPATPVVLFHRVLKPMVLLQITQHVFVVQHRALRIQACIVTPVLINQAALVAHLESSIKQALSPLFH